MIANGIRVGGALTFWSLAEHTSRDLLEFHWQAEGFREFVPEARVPLSAMRDALEDVFGGPNILVRPLSGRDGWTVVKEERGTHSNVYHHMLTATIDKKYADPFISPFSEAVPVVVEKYKHFLGTLRVGQVTSSLVRILHHLGATSLRPKGGVYAVPDPRLNEWERLAQATEKASPASRVYLLRHIMDADAVRAIRDAIQAEVLCEARRINDEIATQDLGERALENRKQQAQDLRSKVLLYEDLLSVGLGHLLSALATTEEAAARATMLQAVGGGA